MGVPGFIVVSGLPASGKTAIGRRIAERLGVPMLDKDDFLEARFEEHSSIGPDLRTRLSRQSDEKFADAAAALEGAVLVSFWRSRGQPVSYGTATEWIDQLSGPVVELHCQCDPNTARERFEARTRHPGHNDASRRGDLGRQLEEIAALGPLGAWPCVTVETSDLSDIENLAAKAARVVQTALASAP